MDGDDYGGVTAVLVVPALGARDARGNVVEDWGAGATRTTLYRCGFEPDADAIEDVTGDQRLVSTHKLYCTGTVTIPARARMEILGKTYLVVDPGAYYFAGTIDHHEVRLMIGERT